MTTRLNRRGYQELIDGNIAWLDKQPRTLERDHIRMVLDRAVEYEYGPEKLTAAGRMLQRAKGYVRAYEEANGSPAHPQRDKTGKLAAIVELSREIVRLSLELDALRKSNVYLECLVEPRHDVANLLRRSADYIERPHQLLPVIGSVARLRRLADEFEAESTRREDPKTVPETSLHEKAPSKDAVNPADQ